MCWVGGRKESDSDGSIQLCIAESKPTFGTFPISIFSISAHQNLNNKGNQILFLVSVYQYLYQR